LLLDFERLKARAKPAVIAHRGLAVAATENTREAFEAAITAAADGIECDIRRTRDGIMVIHHDDTVGDGREAIADLGFEAVIRLAEAAGYIIPTLEETLERCRDRVALDLELKERGYEGDVVDLALKYYRRTNIIFTSFSQKSLKAIRRHFPAALTGLLLHGGSNPRTFWEMLRRHAPGREPSGNLILPHWRLLQPGWLKLMPIDRRAIIPWTVNDRSLAERLIGQGAAAVITDRPDLMGDLAAPPDRSE